ncbi:hypothetical protein BKA69DRAFT_121119 [Paraphysoderma sedebokerense]|nr:hypothetical protein BKA69DRAFT_121119 [Paraphysoderma sedebokerense]
MNFILQICLACTHHISILLPLTYTDMSQSAPSPFTGAKSNVISAISPDRLSNPLPSPPGILASTVPSFTSSDTSVATSMAVSRSLGVRSDMGTGIGIGISTGLSPPLTDHPDDPWKSNSNSPKISSRSELAETFTTVRNVTTHSIIDSSGGFGVGISDKRKRSVSSNSRRTSTAGSTSGEGLSGNSSNIKRRKEPFEWILKLDKVTVKFAPEKGGYVFKHVNYIVESQHHQSSVTRRYSDFLWLHDILLKKYSFRLVLGLPPKKINAGEIFLEKRRKALSRYINFIARHPVLREDEYVVLFLKEQVEIQAYRKSPAAKPPLNDESSTRVLTQSEMNSIPSDIEEQLGSVRKGLRMAWDKYDECVKLMERIFARGEASGVDLIKYGSVLNELSNPALPLYNTNCPDYEMMARGFTKIAGGLEKVAVTWVEQTRCANEGMIENLKAHRDMIHAFEALLQRHEKHHGSTIHALDTIQKRVAMSQNKLDGLQHSGGSGNTTPSGTAAVMEKEKEKLDSSIREDNSAIAQIYSRLQHIRYILSQELKLYHQYHYFISIAYQDFMREQVKYSGKLGGLWEGLERMAFELPVCGENDVVETARITETERKADPESAEETREQFEKATGNRIH